MRSLVLEPELVGDVGAGRRRCCRCGSRKDVVAELVEVRAARRFLQRDVVGDQRHRVRLVRADERVYVGAVGDRVLGDLRRFAMRRHAITSQAGKELEPSRERLEAGSDGLGRAETSEVAPYGQPIARAIRAARSWSRSRVRLVPANTSMSPNQASRTCTMIGPASAWWTWSAASIQTRFDFDIKI